MTTQSKPRTDRTLERLDPELLQRVDAARGKTARGEWVATALEERLAGQSTDDEPVEDLDVAPKRAKIRFRQKLYELRNIAEFGPVEQHNLNVDGQKFARIWQSEDTLSAEDTQAQELERLCDSLFDRVLVADAEVCAQFTMGEKARVVLAFTVAPARQLAQLMSMIQEFTQPGSGESSESATTS